MKTLACSVALHPDGAPLRLALAVDQTAPPMVEFTQDAAPTAARHLFATLGLETKSAVTIGSSSELAKGCVIHFVLCRVAPLVRAHWKHLQPDGTPVTGSWIAFDDLPQNPVLDWITANL